MVYAKHLFSFWEPEILVHARWKVPPLPGPIKTLAESNEFPWLTAPHMCCQKSSLEELSSSCGTPLLGEDSGKLVTSLLQISPHALFPFANTAVYPFAALNLSHYYDRMLNPMSPPSQSLNLGLVLGTPNTISILKQK